MTTIVSENYRELSELVDDPLCMTVAEVRERVGLLDLAGHACLHAASIGLRHRGVAYGRKLLVDGVALESRAMYALAPVGIGSEIEAAMMIARAIVQRHGPGDWWTIGDAVAHCGDDGMIPCGKIDGVDHVLLRSYYYHRPIRQARSLLDETDRSRLREQWKGGGDPVAPREYVGEFPESKQ